MTKDSIELKNCPCCGSSNIVSDYEDYGTILSIHCANCGISIDGGSCNSHLISAAWNTRQSPSPEDLTAVVEVVLSKNDLAYEISHGDTSENDAAKLIAQAISHHLSGEGE